MSTKWLRESLAEEANAAAVIMIASPSQEVLVKVLAAEAARLKAGALANSRVYVVSDKAHAQQVRAALAHAGGKLIIIDPNESIPQPKARLDEFRSRQAETERPALP